MSIPFGGIELDPIELAINGNAILGIKESGKSYLGTELGEVFFDAKIPFITFDPIGIWHNMRYPGRGKGFPVVVAGGFHGDLELTPANAPSIVKAAMQEGVSLVIDLFHPELSKSDWRRIVKDCAFLLLHENAQYGLRHIFIEEAAEFVPQTVRDGQVFDAVERVIRMGGNSQLGCTLISPRSQEVNKSVLELCESLFLFRQRGKNALENIKKWLDVAGADGKEVMRTLPTMPRGECWAWLGGSDHPVHVKVPQKRSFHPDRRAIGGSVVPSTRAVDVKNFVGKLAKALPEIEAAVAANDPRILKARIAELEKAAAQKPAAQPELVQQQREQIQALTGHVAQLQATADKTVPLFRDIGAALEAAHVTREKVDVALEEHERAMEQVQRIVETAGADVPISPPPPGYITPAPPAPRPVPVPRGPVEPRMIQSPADVTGSQQKILDKLAWGCTFFNEASLERQVLSFLIGKHPRTKSVLNDLGSLRTGGLIEYLTGGKIGFTETGRLAASWPAATSRADLIAGVKSVLSPRQGEIIDLLLCARREVPRSEIADHFGLHERTKSFLNDLGKMRTIGVIYYGNGSIGLADFLQEK